MDKIAHVKRVDNIRDFIRRLTLMHVEASELGMYKTMYVVHKAVQQVGYEFAEQLDKAVKKRGRTRALRVNKGRE